MVNLIEARHVSVVFDDQVVLNIELQITRGQQRSLERVVVVKPSS